MDSCLRRRGGSISRSWSTRRIRDRSMLRAGAWFEAGFFESVAVEHVVGVEGDEALAVRVGDVDAGLFDAAEVEGLGVDELDDEDAEEVVVAEVFGGEDLGEAAEEFAEGAGL